MLYPFVLSFKKSISFVEESSDRVVLQSPLVTLNLPQISLNLDRLSPGLLAAFKVLAAEGGTEAYLTDLVIQSDGLSQLPQFYYYLEQFINLGILCYTVLSEGLPLATLVPLSPHPQFQLQQAAKNQQYILSRFAYSRREQTQMVLESPLSHAQIICIDSRCGTLIAELAQPQRAKELCHTVSGISEETIQQFFSLLLTAQMLHEVTAEGTVPEDENQTLRQWEFHDLLFHSRSRTGRNSNRFGKTFRFLGEIEQPPTIKPKMSDDIIELYKPDIETLKENDDSLTQVLERRKSIRGYQDEQPITLKQLGEFLYRVARIKDIFPKDYGECGNRPFPSGGTRHPLELYVTVNICEGISSGLYHYHPLDHQLCRIAHRTSQVEALIEEAGLATSKLCVPQVLIILAARFQRTTWAYQSMAYATILKDVGVLYQTMYLVATAMNLAPCAIGLGNADLFAAVAGTDYYAESSVGEFILGSNPVE